MMIMSQYARLYDMESENSKALGPDDRRFLIEIERLADGGPG